MKDILCRAAQTGVIHAGSTKQEPIVVGKPAEFMLANIAETFGLRRDQICMVGDRLDTDIKFGQDGGLATVLTLSGRVLVTVWLPWLLLSQVCARSLRRAAGVTTEKALLDPSNNIQPDFYIDSLAELLSTVSAVTA